MSPDKQPQCYTTLQPQRHRRHPGSDSFPLDRDRHRDTSHSAAAQGGLVPAALSAATAGGRVGLAGAGLAGTGLMTTQPQPAGPQEGRRYRCRLSDTGVSPTQGTGGVLWRHEVTPLSSPTPQRERVVREAAALARLPAHRRRSQAAWVPAVAARALRPNARTPACRRTTTTTTSSQAATAPAHRLLFINVYISLMGANWNLRAGCASTTTGRHA